MTLDWCVQQALTFLEDDVQARFAADPLGVLRTDLGMTVTAVQHLAEMRDDGGACDGVSFLQDDVIRLIAFEGVAGVGVSVAG